LSYSDAPILVFALPDRGNPGSRGGGANVKIIAMTDRGNADDRRTVMQAGFDAHIVWPIRAAELRVTPAPRCHLVAPVPVSRRAFCYTFAVDFAGAFVLIDELYFANGAGRRRLW
jgi:CheY-like chemotaxis protein